MTFVDNKDFHLSLGLPLRPRFVRPKAGAGSNDPSPVFWWSIHFSMLASDEEYFKNVL